MQDSKEILSNVMSLDPADWEAIRELGHQMIDDMMDQLQNIRSDPSWRKIPNETKKFLKGNVPQSPQDISAIYEEFKNHILPYPSGNIHPRHALHRLLKSPPLKGDVTIPIRRRRTGTIFAGRPFLSVHFLGEQKKVNGHH